MKKLIFAIDIDGVLCKDLSGNFHKAKPMQEAIDVVNELYDAGHTIMIFTARGKKEANVYALDRTIEQLKKWGVKYHEISAVKPFFDVLVEDKSFQSMLALKKAMEKFG